MNIITLCQGQSFLYRYRLIRVNFDFHKIMRKHLCVTSFQTYKIYNSVVIVGPSNTKYLGPSEILINPSILSCLICKGFGPINVMKSYEMSQIKIFSCDFPSIDILSRSKSSDIIMASK